MHYELLIPCMSFYNKKKKKTVLEYYIQPMETEFSNKAETLLLVFFFVIWHVWALFVLFFWCSESKSSFSTTCCSVCCFTLLWPRWKNEWIFFCDILQYWLTVLFFNSRAGLPQSCIYIDDKVIEKKAKKNSLSTHLYSWPQYENILLAFLNYWWLKRTVLMLIKK